MRRNLFQFMVFLSVQSFGGEIGIRNFHEIYNGYSEVTQIHEDKEISDFFEKVKGALPKHGTVSEFQPSVQLISMNLASRFCTELIERDSCKLNPANRVAHRKIDFLKTPGEITMAGWESVVQEYSELFWQRNARETELLTTENWLKNELSSAINATSETKVILRLLCTGMATSAQFFII